MEDVQTELYISYIILGKAKNKLDFLDYKRKYHIKMIEDFNRSLMDMKNQMELDVKQLKVICKEIPLEEGKDDFIGLASMNIDL